jgi:DNA-binding LacI/PurR family transcriptional regulator
VPNEPGGGRIACERLLRLREPPTAFFATTDVLAIGALNSAQAAGWGVPGDLSVVGFDDIPFAAYTVPELTTVRQPIEAMARLVVDIALHRAADPGAPPETHLLNPELVIRNSTMQAPNRKEVTHRQ